MFGLLRKGGMMAVQIPMNYEEPVHKIIAQMRKDSYWNIHTGRTIDTLSQEEYYNILSDMSKDVSVWQTTYFHILHSHEDILEWYRSTGLKPYLDELSANPELKAEFEKAPTDENSKLLIKTYDEAKKAKLEKEEALKLFNELKAGE